MGALTGRIGSRLPLTVGPLVTACGFALMLRIGSHAAYWTQVLPALLVIAAGLFGAVAPLTTAVLSSVDGRHTGSASGLNTAVARTGGLAATALLGSIMSARGGPLLAGFHAAACIMAALAIRLLLRAKDADADPRER